MARHSSAKLCPSLFPTECAPRGSPVPPLQLPPATNFPRQPAVLNLPICFASAKAACTYPVSATPTLRSLERRSFQSALPSGGESSKALRAHALTAGDRRTANVQVTTYLTHRTPYIFDERSSSRPVHTAGLCATPQLQPLADPQAARGSHQVNMAQRRKYATFLKDRNAVSQFSSKSTPPPVPSSPCRFPAQRPCPVAPTPSLKASPNATKHSAGATVLPRSPNLLGRTQANTFLMSSGTGSEDIAMQRRRAAPGHRRVNSGCHRLGGEQVWRQVSFRDMSELCAPLSSESIASCHVEHPPEPCSAASRSVETPVPLAPPEEIDSLELRRPEWRYGASEEGCETQVAQPTKSVFVSFSYSPATIAQARAGVSEATVNQGKTPLQARIGDGHDNRNSTSPPISRNMSDVHKSGSRPHVMESETSTICQAIHNWTHAVADSAEINSRIYSKKSRLNRHAQEDVSVARRPPNNQGNAGELNQYSNNFCDAQRRTPFGEQVRSLPGSTGPQAQQSSLHTREHIWVPHTFHLPSNALHCGGKAVGQSELSLPRRQQQPEVGCQFRGMENSAAVETLVGGRQTSSHVRSTQEGFLHVQCPNIDGFSRAMQPRALGANSCLPLAEQARFAQHAPLPTPSQSYRVVFQNQEATSLHRSLGQNAPGLTEAAPPLVCHFGLTSSLANGPTRRSTPVSPVSLLRWLDLRGKDNFNPHVYRDHVQKKLSRAQAQGVRRDYGVLRAVRPVFKRTVPHVQTSTTIRADGRAREQIRNRAVLKRLASAGVTAAAATAAGTLLAVGSPAIAGLAVAGVAALLTGVAAASATADAPQCYRRQQRRKVSAPPYSSDANGATRFLQGFPHGSMGQRSLSRGEYAAAWCPQAAREHTRKVSQTSRLVSHLSTTKDDSLGGQKPASKWGTFDSVKGCITSSLPLPEVFSVKSYGKKPNSGGTLLLVGRPMNSLMGH